MDDLAKKRCIPCEGGIPSLSSEEAEALLKKIPGWSLSDGKITRTYKFKNYYENIAFVNATAWISHRENHHPDIVLGYNKCEVNYSTHAAKGLTENDFICAAKFDALFDL